MKILCGVLESLPVLTGSKASSYFSESYREVKTDKGRGSRDPSPSGSTQHQAVILMQKAVRAYVHVLCVVSLKPTRSLGDLHLVDRAEQSAKSENLSLL